MKMNQSVKQIAKNNAFIFGLCFKAAPSFCILYILNVIRHELMIFLEFTFGLNYVLESAEFGRPFFDVLIFLIILFSFAGLGLLFDSYVSQKVQQKGMPKVKKQFILLLVRQMIL